MSKSQAGGLKKWWEVQIFPRESENSSRIGKILHRSIKLPAGLANWCQGFEKSGRGVKLVKAEGTKNLMGG